MTSEGAMERWELYVRGCGSNSFLLRLWKDEIAKGGYSTWSSEHFNIVEAELSRRGL